MSLFLFLLASFYGLCLVRGVVPLAFALPAWYHCVDCGPFVCQSWNTSSITKEFKKYLLPFVLRFLG
jgi:hypothetical protein